MADRQRENEISGEDLREALKEIKEYVDITADDLSKIYKIALRHAQERLASKVSVGDVMTKAVVTVKRDADIHEVARILSENNISGLPVVDEGDHVIGMVTEGDILYVAGMREQHTFKDILRHILGEPLPRRQSGDIVENIMTSPAITANHNADLPAMSRILSDRRIKRLPVVDNENRLVGIISRADIVRSIGKQ